MVFGEGISPDNDGTQRNPNANDSHPPTPDTSPLTRRELREQRAAAASSDGDLGAPASSGLTKMPVNPASAIASVVPAPFLKSRANSRGTTAFRSLATGAVMTLAVGLVATMALPSYAYTQADGFDATAATAPLTLGQQSLTVSATATSTAVNRDGYKAPTEGELAQARAAAEAAAAAQARVATSSSASGTAARPNFVINPPSGSYSGEALVAFADQFVGKVPYGSGNSPTTSFGCDGLTQYVFGAFGISLPRGVSAQAGMGIRISPDDVRAGDLVVWPGAHIAIADGHGGYVNAPDWGRYVEHTSNWWGSYYFVRIVG